MRLKRKFAAFLVLAVFCSACSKKQEPQPAEEDSAKQDAAATETAYATPGDAAEPEPSPPPVTFDHAEVQPEAAATQAPKATSRSDMAKDVEPAELKTYFPPFYPLSLRMEGVEGRIDLQFKIDATGAVVDVSVLNATAPQFREYALEAGRVWEFFPALKAGEPIPISIVIPVQFISEFGSGELPPNSPLAGLTYLDGSYYTSDANGRYQPANLQLTPLARSQPSFQVPEGNTEPVRATLMFTVTEEGRVLNPEVIEATNAEFGEAAMTAVRFWQFVPRIKNGKPVSSQVKLPIVLGSEGSTG